MSESVTYGTLNDYSKESKNQIMRTIDEVVKAKMVLEGEIQELFAEFMAENGIRIAGVSVKSTDFHGIETITEVNVFLK